MGLETIDNKYKNSSFNDVLEEIEKYWSSKEVGVYDLLFDTYIMCQIKLGMFDEAIKSIELCKRLFPNYQMNKPYELACRYAMCARKDKLEEILNNNNFTIDEYYGIAFHCLRNGNIDLAKELFSKIVYSEEESKRSSKIRAEKALSHIDNYEKNKEKAFLKQSYAYFMYNGNNLEPGHVVFVNRVRNDYAENRDFNDPKRADRPYMIWKIDGDLIYAFPITTKLNKNRRTFFAQDYAFQHPDRCLKDRIVCIRKGDIANIEDKINEKDLKLAINQMYRSVYISHRGTYSDDIAFFMQEFAKGITATVGDIIVLFDYIRKNHLFYYVCDIDYERRKYKVIELDNKLNPIGEYLSLGYVDMDRALLDANPVYNEQIKISLEQIKPSVFNEEDLVGIVFCYGNKTLEILEETPDSYICMNVRNGYIPETLEIFFVNKHISLFNIKRVSEDILKEQQKLFDEYKQNNIEEFVRKSEEFKRVLKKQGK